MFTLKLASNRAVHTTVHQSMRPAAVLGLQTIWADVFHCKLGCEAQKTPLGLCIRLSSCSSCCRCPALLLLYCCSGLLCISMNLYVCCHWLQFFLYHCDPTGYQAGQSYSFSSTTQSQAVCNCCLRGAHRGYGCLTSIWVKILQFEQGLSCCKLFRLNSPHITFVEKFLRSLLNTALSSTTI